MRKGFTIVESMIAIGLLLVLVVGFMPIASWYSTRAKRYQYDSQAALVLLETMEATYSVAQSAWPTFSEGQEFHPVVSNISGVDQWELAGGQESNVQTRFTRWVELRSICRDPNSGKLGDFNPVSRTCVDSGYVKDTKGLKAKSYVTWHEATGNKTIDADLLMVKIN